MALVLDECEKVIIKFFAIFTFNINYNHGCSAQSCMYQFVINLPDLQ